MSGETQAAAGQKRRRTRSGCLNCRRKRKKCDEKRPRCLKCSRGGEECQWETFIKFRPPTGISEVGDSTSSGPVELGISQDAEETDQGGSDQASSAGRSKRRRDGGDARAEAMESSNSTMSPRRLENTNGETPGTAGTAHDGSTPHNNPTPCRSGSCHVTGGQHSGDSPAAARPLSSSSNARTATSRLGQTADANRANTDWTSHLSNTASADNYQASMVSSMGLNPGSWARNHASLGDMASLDGATLSDHMLSPNLSTGYEDGIFQRGSTYQDLFQSLRSHVFHTAHSGNMPFDQGSTTGRDVLGAASVSAYDISSSDQLGDTQVAFNMPDGRKFELRPVQEYLLWKAWTEEISTWLDKFDPYVHFRDTFPIIAKDRPHLKYAMLSLSARYLETRDCNVTPSLTLALYQHAIQLLVPQLYMRDIAVIASCVILCVLEMFSCSPKAWRQHLDGCASLMQSLNLRGDSGGPEEAVFWCFARMDLCGGLISLERTLIPVEKWTSEAIDEISVASYPRTGAFHDHAKMAANMIAQVMELFASYRASEGAFGFSAANPTELDVYARKWQRLFDIIQEWFSTRPMEMLPVVSMSAKESGLAFPTVLYSNAAAISGNQFAHTAAILMLQRKPRDLTLGKIRSVLWHARQICGIALSNDHHGAWTNTVQPLWIAGRLMSHPQEHAAIVRVLRRIERETGWATQWRITDLVEHWGDVDD